MSKIELWGMTRVGSRGQVVIPKKAREYLDIKEGDQLLMVTLAAKPGIMIIKAKELESVLSALQASIKNTIKIINKEVKK